MSKNRNRIYTNGEITIYWRARECTHATTCFAELRSVFDPAKRPWVNPHGATSEQIKHIIEKCPTDALTFSWNDPGRNETEKSPKLFTGNIETYFDKPAYAPKGTDPEVEPCPVTLTIRPNGPIIIEGDFEIITDNLQPLRPMKVMSLCRCGHSSNQPFCDGTHFAHGFSD